MAAEVKLRGYDDLVETIIDLQIQADYVREDHTKKIDWYLRKSDEWKKSELGKAWKKHLSEVEDTLEELEELSEWEYVFDEPSALPPP